MRFGSRKEGVQANCGGKFQTNEVLKKHVSDGAEAHMVRKTVLTQNRKRGPGSRQKDLGPHKRAKLRSDIGL